MPKQKSAKIDKTQLIVAFITALTAMLAAYWQFVWKPSHDITSAPIDYIGRVVDYVSQNPVKGAQVALDFQGVPPIVYTDDNGVYRFTLALSNEKIDGRIRIEIAGYEKYDRFITIYKNTPTIDEIRLTPSQPPTPSSSIIPKSGTGICGGEPVKIVLPTNSSDFDRKFGYTEYSTVNSYIDPNQGLLTNVIRSLFVDQNGIWVGYGGSKDGEKGISFVSNPVDGARVWEMCLDRNGKAIGYIANSITADSKENIWVATDGNGVWKLQNGVWEQFAQDDLVVSPSGALLPVKSTFNVIAQGDNILAGTLYGLFSYNGINWTKVASLEEQKIHAVAFAKNGDIWIGFIDQGVRRINPDGAFQDFNTTNSEITNDNVRSIVVDNDGKVWIATAGGGVNVFDDGNWSFYRANTQGIQSDNVNPLALDRFGRIWAGTDMGTSYFDTSTKQWKLYTNLATLAIAFGKSTRERCSYQDDPVWIGTNGQGLLNSRLPPLTPIIKNYNIYNLPTIVKPGDKLTPLIIIELIDGYQMSTGDFLQSTETTEYTPSPIVAVNPDKLNNNGQEVQISFSDNPITAPQQPGSYELVWRLWQCGRYVDPSITLTFTVANP